MVYSLLLHPHTQTSNAFVQLQANHGRLHAGHSSRTVHISCSSAIDADVTLVDAIICTTESNIDVREGTMHLRHCERTSWPLNELPSHSHAGFARLLPSDSLAGHPSQHQQERRQIGEMVRHAGDIVRANK